MLGFEDEEHGVGRREGGREETECMKEKANQRANQSTPYSM